MATRTPTSVLRKSLGQHLLQTPELLRLIADAADIRESDHVLEVGPGTGNLTMHLLERAGAVTAIELSEELHDVVTRRVDMLCVLWRGQVIILTCE